MTADKAAGRHGPLLDVSGLGVALDTDEGTLAAVHDVSFTIDRGRTLVVLGESGCGKSVTALALMGLLPRAEVSGRATLDGTDLLASSPAVLRRLRDTRVAMIFQDALDALNPVHTVGDQIAEAVRAHAHVSRREARSRSIDLMQRVSIPSPAARFGDYPHQFSGGMRQRVMIAMALAQSPALLIADEPTTALDVTVQAQILDLLSDIQEESRMALMLITHDLGVAVELADQVAVMYAGRVVESGPVDRVVTAPQHPYTRGLLASSPQLTAAGDRLPTIPGLPPSLTHMPSGCAFHPRCPIAVPRCAQERPPLRPTPSGAAACHFAGEES